MQVYTGVDVGKSFCEFFVLNEERDCVYRDRIPTLDMGKWRETLSLFDGHELHLAFEVGPHYEWMYDLCREFCHEVVVVDARAFKLVSQSQKKTDKIDAEKLAEGLWRGDLPTVHVPEKPVRDDRRLIAHLHQLSRMVSSLKQRIRSLLFAARLRCPYADLLGMAGQAWLSNTGRPALGEQDRLVFDNLMEQLRLVVQQQGAWEQEVKDRAKRYSDCDLARSIPGFGWLVTLGVLSAVAGFKRFDSPDQLAHYFGLCPKVEQSGSSLRLGHITKAGNNHVRWLLAQAVSRLIRKDNKVRRRYFKLRRKKKSKVALVAVMRWVTTVLWRMIANQEKFRLDGLSGKHLKRAAA